MTDASLSCDALGTRWKIDLLSPVPKAQILVLRAQIVARLEEFEATFSRFREGSLLAQIAQGAGSFELPRDAQPLLDLYERLYRVTDGRVTPLIGQVLADAGYDASYTLRPRVLTTPPVWEEVMTYDFPHLTTTVPVSLDFGAIGKGYAVDLVSVLVEAAGIPAYCIDAGGDMRHRGGESSKAYRVGLEDPSDFSRVIGVVTLEDQSLCGSSGSRRKWDRFHHLIDPKTLESPRDVLATWVVADTTMLADGLATALFFVSPDVLLQEFSFDYAVLGADRSVRTSPKMPIELF